MLMVVVVLIAGSIAICCQQTANAQAPGASSTVTAAQWVGRDGVACSEFFAAYQSVKASCEASYSYDLWKAVLYAMFLFGIAMAFMPCNRCKDSQTNSRRWFVTWLISAVLFATACGVLGCLSAGHGRDAAILRARADYLYNITKVGCYPPPSEFAQ